MSEIRAQVLVAGGGLGGVAAALAACRSGCHVVLTEPADWLGGQLTSQAVPPAHQVHGDSTRLEAFQADLRRQGFELDWPRVRGY